MANLLAVFGAAAILAVLLGGLWVGVRPPAYWVSNLGVDNGAVAARTRPWFRWSLAAGGAAMLWFLFREVGPVGRVLAVVAVAGLEVVAFFDMRAWRKTHVAGANAFFLGIASFVAWFLIAGGAAGWRAWLSWAALAASAAFVSATVVGFARARRSDLSARERRAAYIQFMTYDEHVPTPATLLTVKGRNRIHDTVRTLEWLAVLLLVAWVVGVAV